MSKSTNSIRDERDRLGLSQAKLAELAQVPQHLLSAFELGKSVLPERMLSAIEVALSDEKLVAKIAGRRKRYREHRFQSYPQLPDRVDRACSTIGNPAYLDVLADLSRRHRCQKKDGPRAIGLFSGCGGFSYGFSAAGFEVVAFLDVDRGLRNVYRQNFSDAKMLGGDIAKISESNLHAFRTALGPIDAIVGGPPCQGFSLAGKRQVDDPRNELFQQYLRFVDAMRPQLAVLENVRLLTSMKSRNGTNVRDDISGEFERRGYRIRCFEINAKDYGVPQHRERVFFVALRNDLNCTPTFPVPTHGVEPGPAHTKGFGP